MRYPPEYKEEKRRQLIAASSALIKQGGYAATGIDKLMEGAGVTSGAFYSHFGSKTALLEALIPHELQLSRDAWQNNPHAEPADWLEFELERYLNLKHVRHPEAGCMLPSLGAEIARADEATRKMFEEEMNKGVAMLEEKLGNPALAWAFICQLAGAILIARAVPDKTTQLAVLDSSKLLLRTLFAAA
ncbi:MAG TPA: TetR/AcrR family transcriptional regulator [Burkholderiaceae bacterium]|jgi:AcrR family transcriptional regulator